MSLILPNLNFNPPQKKKILNIQTFVIIHKCKCTAPAYECIFNIKENEYKGIRINVEKQQLQRKKPVIQKYFAIEI